MAVANRLKQMHPLFQKASALTESIIAAAIEVHRDKGPGLIESIYEWCLLKELGLRRFTCVSQRTVIVEYRASLGRNHCALMFSSRAAF